MDKNNDQYGHSNKLTPPKLLHFAMRTNQALMNVFADAKYGTIYFIYLRLKEIETLNQMWF